MRTVLLVLAALAAFAGNSLLGRLGLRPGLTDPASFTAIRLGAGAVVLWWIVRARSGVVGGSWGSAAALFAYAGAFSFAYAGLAAGTGALLLFGAVQATMVIQALWVGVRLGAWQWAGLVLALAGLVALLLPGLSAPPPVFAAAMLASGVAWGVYTIRGRRPGDATAATAGNFARTLPFAAAWALLAGRSVDPGGAAAAVLSGALTSALGYAAWYAVLPRLSPQVAATVQLSVPALAAFAAVPVLGEALTPRLLAGSGAILGGIALVILARRGSV